MDSVLVSMCDAMESTIAGIIQLSTSSSMASMTTEIDQTKISVVRSNSYGSGGIFPAGGGSRGHPGGSGGYHSCYSDEWKCLNCQCIRSIRQCDGKADCIDGSDDMQCPGGSFPGPNRGEINIGGHSAHFTLTYGCWQF